MRERTAEQAKADYVSIMGQPLGELYAELWQEVVLLYRNWDVYVELYGTKPTRVDLLNRAAGSFFRVVQDSLWEQTLLHLARLTDPPASAGKQNLSVRRLLLEIHDESIKSHVSPKVDEALSACAFCRDWRNRRIAHRDLDLALERSVNPIATATRIQVRSALDRVADVLNAVAQKYFDSETHFEGSYYPGGAVSLLHILDAGLDAHAERLARLQRGDHRPEDFNRKEL